MKVAFQSRIFVLMMKETFYRPEKTDYYALRRRIDEVIAQDSIQVYGGVGQPSIYRRSGFDRVAINNDENFQRLSKLAIALGGKLRPFNEKDSNSFPLIQRKWISDGTNLFVLEYRSRTVIINIGSVQFFAFDVFDSRTYVGGNHDGNLSEICSSLLKGTTY